MNKELMVEKLTENFKNFIEELRLSDYAISEVAKEYTSRKARYTIALARTKSKLLELKLEQKKVYYEIYREIREAAKGQRLTEETIKSLIFTDDRYLQISKKVIETEEMVSILEACKEAFDDLGRMLYLLYGKEDTTMV